MFKTEAKAKIGFGDVRYVEGSEGSSGEALACRKRSVVWQQAIEAGMANGNIIIPQ